MLIDDGLAWPRWAEGSDLGGRLVVSASSWPVTMHLSLHVDGKEVLLAVYYLAAAQAEPFTFRDGKAESVNDLRARQLGA